MSDKLADYLRETKQWLIVDAGFRPRWFEFKGVVVERDIIPSFGV
jgi:hypothetical protein